MSEAENSVDTAIVGAGPAGLQLAYFLHREGTPYVVLEAQDHVGSFFSKYPRHGQLLSINKRYTGRAESDFNLRHDWNCLLRHRGDEMPFSEYSGDYFPRAEDLVRYLGDFARPFERNTRLGCSVDEVRRGKSLIIPDASRGTLGAISQVRETDFNQ